MIKAKSRRFFVFDVGWNVCAYLIQRVCSSLLPVFFLLFLFCLQFRFVLDCFGPHVCFLFSIAAANGIFFLSIDFDKLLFYIYCCMSKKKNSKSNSKLPKKVGVFTVHSKLFYFLAVCIVCVCVCVYFFFVIREMNFWRDLFHMCAYFFFSSNSHEADFI